MSSNMNSQTQSWTLVDSYPFRQPERVFFNPYNQNEMWVTSFGNGMKVGLLTPAAIHEIPDENSLIDVYPNPFKEQFGFSNFSESPVRIINIYNANGKLVLSEQVEKKSVHTASLDPGVYVIEFILKNNAVVHKKIVKD